MKKAKELLLKQELNVGEIAIACGFETPYYFSNTFKKFLEFHLLPGEKICFYKST